MSATDDDDIKTILKEHKRDWFVVCYLLIKSGSSRKSGYENEPIILLLFDVIGENNFRDFHGL